jgi:FixJ family two-component response regulator
VEYWLLNCTGYSNRRIADEIGVDHKTVEIKRVEMESIGEIP